MAETKTYNGWTNYETWNVKLWMDNDEGSYKHWQEQAQDAWDQAERENGSRTFTREENAALDLRDRLKEHFENEKDEMLDQAKLSSSMWADLMGAALSEVNWDEIAANMIEDVEKEPEETDDDAE